MTNLNHLIELLRVEETPVDKITEEIQRHPRLTDELLRQANSITFALQRQVSTLEHAITILGRLRVQENVSRVARHDPPHTLTHARHFDKQKTNSLSRFKNEVPPG